MQAAKRRKLTESGGRLYQIWRPEHDVPRERKLTKKERRKQIKLELRVELTEPKKKKTRQTKRSENYDGAPPPRKKDKDAS